jgi:ankyrin repeat protein
MERETSEDFIEFQMQLLHAIRLVSQTSDDEIDDNEPKQYPTDMDFTFFRLLVEEAQQLKFDLSLPEVKTKYTPIHFAMTRTSPNNEKRMLEVFKLLMKHGADVNKPSDDQGKFTPMHTACRRGLPNCVRYLLENGAQLETKHFKDGKMYKSALDYVNEAITSTKTPYQVKQRFFEIQTAIAEYQKKESNQGLYTLIWNLPFWKDVYHASSQLIEEQLNNSSTHIKKSV